MYFGTTLARVDALDAATGVKKWEFPDRTASNPPSLVSVYSTPAIANGKVYFGAYDNKFYALDAATGQPKWAQPFTVGAAVVPTPVVANGMVYFGANNSQFYALDAETGVLRWNIATQDKVWSDATFDNGTIYFGSLGRTMYAVDANSGSVKWTHSAEGMIVSKPLVANGAVYFGALDKLYAVEAGSGQLKWQLKLGDPSDWIWSDPTMVGTTIYLGTLSGKVYAIDAATGSQKWQQPFAASGQIRSAIVVRDNVGYFGTSDQKLYALDLGTAQLKWNPLPLQGPIFASPALEGDTLYVATHGYNMYALNANDGTRKWCFDANTNQACAQ